MIELGIWDGFSLIASEGDVDTNSEGNLLEAAEGCSEGLLLGPVLIDGDMEGLDVGCPVTEGASLGIWLGGEDGIRDGLFDMIELGIGDGFSLVASEGVVESASDGIKLGAAEGYCEGCILGVVLIDGDIEGLDVGYSVSDGASLRIRLGGDDGMCDGLFDTTKLGIEDGFSLILSEGAVESTSDGIELGAA